MKRNLCCVSVSTLFFFVSMLLVPQMSYGAEVGTCRKARNVRAEKKAPHVYFTIDTGKKLLLELKELRSDKKRLKLIEQKIQLHGEIQSWYKLQIKAAEKTVEKLTASLAVKNKLLSEKDKKIAKQDARIRKLTVSVAKYKGERYQWLVYGVGGTLLVTVLGVVAVGIYVGVSGK